MPDLRPQPFCLPRWGTTILPQISFFISQFQGGANVILIARRAEALSKVADRCIIAHKESGLKQGGKFASIQLDVSDKQQIASLWTRVPQDLRDVDILGMSTLDRHFMCLIYIIQSSAQLTTLVLLKEWSMSGALMSRTLKRCLRRTFLGWFQLPSCLWKVDDPPLHNWRHSEPILRIQAEEIWACHQSWVNCRPWTLCGRKHIHCYKACSQSVYWLSLTGACQYAHSCDWNSTR